MEIKEEIRGDVAVLHLSGKMMGGPDTMKLHEHVKGLIADGLRKLVIDLADVKWLNSSGMGALIMCLTSVRNARGQLKLSAITEKVESLLMITHLLTVFETAETAERAVGSFNNVSMQ
ncbi:STAS domain-containing protein [bacterium]|nr:STAS domain-containing protein [bacterium]